MSPAVSKYHFANVQVVKGLNPTVRALFYEFLVRLAVAGIRVRLTSGYRSVAEQYQLWLQGRGKPGPIVTDERGDGSWHCWGLAIDIAPLTFNGLWYSVDNRGTTYEQIARIAKDIGIEWGFAVWNFDKPHFMYRGGFNIADLQNGHVIASPKFAQCYSTLPVPTQQFLVKQKSNLIAAGITFPL